MLSFGQYQLNYSVHHSQGASILSNSQHPYGANFTSSSYPQTTIQQQPGRTNSATNLPLTPPGSPDDEEEGVLVICDSPQKTPIKEQARNIDVCNGGGNRRIDAVAANTTSCVQQQQQKNDYSLFPFPYGASFNCSATATSVITGELDNNFSLFNAANNIRSPSSIYDYTTNTNGRLVRQEKKPVSDLMKDQKYYERRQRNNEAAKKSRDARKQREDEIANRAAFLEKDNAILRAQVATLREEAQNLRLLLLQKRERQMEIHGLAAAAFASNIN